MKGEQLERWTIEQSAELYNIRSWGNGFFDINNRGEVVVRLRNGSGDKMVALTDIIAGLKERGMHLPVLLRFADILDSCISQINESFAAAIKTTSYKGQYRGVFPIKVNQQEQVVAEIASFGRRYHHGLEAGSKAELIAAIAHMRDPEAYIICNGYKDEEWADLAFHAQKLGMQVILVVEYPGELEMLVRRAKAIGVRPRLGLRAKLSSRTGGKWSESSGDRSVFGLTPADIIKSVDFLREQQMLDCLHLLHYHLGSQIPNITSIRNSVNEAVRVYINLVKEGAAMGILDIGGGLAIDYDGSHTNFPSSRNYDLLEYCTDVCETVMNACDKANIPHPTLVSESGRALVAYSSVLVFNVLEHSRFEAPDLPESLPEDTPEQLRSIAEVHKHLTLKNLQESFHDAVFYRDELRNAFLHDSVTLRQRALGEQYFWKIVNRIARESQQLKYVPDELQNLGEVLSDIYYGNFSVFQSLPDSWAIDQLFPVMPIHRLKERPGRLGTLADITCDCDGKLDKFIDLHDVKNALPLHEPRPDEDYMLATFLVGAYQETLGDLHNLFGDTNVVSIRIDDDGEIDFTDEVQGDTVADVLQYVEYDVKELIDAVRDHAERAVRAKRITPQERREIIEAYENGMRGYTYFER